MAEKCTQAEKEVRLAVVQELILDGECNAKIMDYVSRKYSLTERMVSEYIRTAWGRIQEANKIDRPNVIARHLKRLDSVAYRARQAQDLHAELKAYDQQAKILGIYQIEVNHHFEKLEGVTDEDLRQDLAVEAIH